MVKCVSVNSYGGPEKLEYSDCQVESPGPGQVLLQQTAIGVNYIDTYHRSGLYPLPLPLIPGSEGAGVVLEVGEGVVSVKPGDRVSYSMAVGAYAEQRLVPEKVLIKLDDDISDELAAAITLKGLTTEYLLRRTFKVGNGSIVLIHAAAGGVGTLACQWAKHLGATVIGTVGTAEKVGIAKQNGCDHVILYTDYHFSDQVRELTNGALCDVVYDGVGKATFPASLDCIRPLGMFVSFGNASGPVESFNLGLLSQKGSLFATRPTLASYAAKRAVLDDMAKELFAVLRSGAVKAPPVTKYKLSEAAEAHRALQARKTTGSLILVP
ncbi:MAG: quinone oxidoreductase [Methylobacteriaceae bacterium]|jgi:NADPH2:quinone reductase|nr:quinone oxidoreductase [Methylobacteriaceae bacterium]